MSKIMLTASKQLIGVFLALLLFPILTIAAFASRFNSKRTKIGLGPEPLINNIYHKESLRQYGYEAETFVNDVYYITQQFDVRADLLFRKRVLRALYLYFKILFTYQCIYIYFTGGPLSFVSQSLPFFWRLEPYLYAIAGIKVVVMPYGGDIQDFTRCPNLLFRHTTALDYPEQRRHRRKIERRIDLWTFNANHVISGCDWVDYMFHWDTLMLAHFSIDTKIRELYPPVPRSKNAPFRILHAPNHRHIKGSHFFIEAVKELQEEGLDIELILLEKVSNQRIKEEIQKADLIADQLIVGWYAMFALEGMIMGKPVLCFLRQDLIDFYTMAGLVQKQEIPLINCNPLTVKNTIRHWALNAHLLPEIGEQSFAYAKKHHSTQNIGKIFDSINRSLSLRK